MSQHYDSLPALFNTPEIRLACPDEIKFDIAAAGSRYRVFAFPVWSGGSAVSRRGTP